jgi:trimeric autotransporter adhesin
MKVSVCLRTTLLLAAFLALIFIPTNSSAQSNTCSLAPTLISAPTCSNTGGSLTAGATYVAIPGGTGCSASTSDDVWYTFFAKSATPTITLSSNTVTNVRLQLFSGSCVGMTSLSCGTLSITAAGLTIGTQYWIRIYSTTNAAGTFNICITDPAPSNDNCAGATVLTSSTTCSTTSGNMYAATVSPATITAPDCAGTVIYDVWYKFVAQTIDPTITLSGIGSSFTNPAMQLLSNNCGGTYTSYFCGTTSIAADYLTPGTTYFIRVYSSSGTAPTSPTNADFDICITDAVAPVPFNDDCAEAINLPIWNTCNNIAGNMAGATASGGALVAPCAGTVAYDVWYKFTAINSNTATISLASIGANFTSTGLQVYSGTCGSLSSIACASGTTVTTPALTSGNVYYVRVFSTSGPAPNGNARFNICATTSNAPVRFGNSYVNLSKKTTGGVVQPGDTLEIRMTINHTSGIMTNLRFVDNVPTKTSMLSTTADSIRVITNEGLTYKKYTPAADLDAATYKAAPGVGEYNVRLNLGFASGSTPGAPTNNTTTATSATGQMNAASDKPKGGGGMLFAVAYRVKVTGVVGDTITLFPAQFIYNNGVSDVTLTATSFKISVTNPLNLCANSIGLNNAVENGGTFGSGTTPNRTTDLTTPIAGYTFIPDVSAITTLGDGRYGIIKNLSPRNSTNSSSRRQNTCAVPAALAPNDPASCNNRMFNGFWYIDGDHSGTGNAAGNAPPAETTNAGYMLVVNADYVASEVYRQTVSNLCPNTYYEFSAWVKNICPTCGIDSTNASTYKPGVLPNLSFALDNLDYYNTGEMDTLGWQKKGFVFRTDTAQTTATFSIRNNAQGGGGNDWALDDIAIATCLPSMQYSPSITPSICNGNSLQINDTVRSYFNNYTIYKWQRSVNSGSTWSDITSTANASLTLNGSLYQFITSFTIPPANTTPADSGDLYRVIVATSNNNLINSSCLFTDASTIITLKVNNCGNPLAIDLLSFSGKVNNGYADLSWVTAREDEMVHFIVEKSLDGINYNSIGTVDGMGKNTENNFYHFTDPVPLNGKAWYRIAMINSTGGKKYSRIITLDDKVAVFSLTNIVNPFSNQIDFDVQVSENSRVEALLINSAGKPIRREAFNVYEGSNGLTLQNTQGLPAGMYILQINNKDRTLTKKLVKK